MRVLYRRIKKYDERCAEMMNEEIMSLVEIIEKSRDPYLSGWARGRIWSLRRRAQMEDCLAYYSGDGQDKFISERLLPHKRDGVFVEIGGYDGITNSNCMHFEMHRYWRGIVVEPVPMYAEMIRKWRRSRVECVAVSAVDGHDTMMSVEKGFTQMSYLTEKVDNPDLGMIQGHPEHRERTIRVRTMKLDTLFEKHDLRRVDYCSIDAEGSEYLILKEFDFDRFEVGVFTIENRDGRPNGISQLMPRHGYRLVDVIGSDEVWCMSSVLP